MTSAGRSRDRRRHPPPASPAADDAGEVNTDVVEWDRHGLEVLSRSECLRLLATTPVGRVALSIGALPVVLPVNFALDGESVVFRTGPGSKLEAATRQAVVAFQADHVDLADETGWSVLLTGVARPSTTPPN